MIKKIAVTVSLLMLFMALTGCVYVGFSPASRLMIGKGEMVTREIDIAGIQTLRIATNAEVELIPGDKAAASITAYPNYFDVLTIRTNDNKLDVYSSYAFDTGIIIKVTAPELSRLIIAGAANFTGDSPLALDHLDMDITGFANGTLNLQAKSVNITTAGACDLTLTGQADELRASLVGGGKIDAYGLKTQQTDITITGAGEINTRCEQALTVSISGAGTVRYYGNPQVTQSIAGVGTIKKTGE